MLSKLLLVFRTIRHLRPIQIYYQVYYRFRSKFIAIRSLGKMQGFVKGNSVEMLDFSFAPKSTEIRVDDQNVSFSFLNLPAQFDLNSVSWNYSENGKLWTYNLNYFDFLFCENLDKATGLELLEKYCDAYDQLKDGLEPYPISLRGINWVKFLSHHKVEDEKIDACLYHQYRILASSLEYHLLANHLLENGFSLLFGAYYFQNQLFYRKAKNILKSELVEQLFEDGGHYERSPMYHQILFYRLLDCLNLVRKNNWMNHELQHFLEEKSSLMLSWLNEVTLNNGDIPMVKDAAYGIAPSTQQLLSYVQTLGIETRSTPLSDSGFRKFFDGHFEMFIDVGYASPAYQPGHAHADELNFIVYHNQTPIVVDTAVSTYQIGDRRNFERSTAAHNCVMIDDLNSSEVWGGFRVGRRAEVRIKSEESDLISASHDGYKAQNIIINRDFAITPNGVEITDTLKGTSGEKAQMNLHFHPGLHVEKLSDNTFSMGGLHLILDGIENASIKSYKFAAGFNQLEEAQKLNWTFLSKSKIRIYAN